MKAYLSDSVFHQSNTILLPQIWYIQMDLSELSSQLNHSFFYYENEDKRWQSNSNNR